ncbi:D-lactate dehydrogenase (cytochrome) [Colletotrichum costaricense]|uniref:D-lactate dehydrogenase (cytochrome) n=1 Tax=Colletotrichum costaricense TaxID=1209916 RepID=A0AAI9YLY0_9PEZI|nr:D-lactate dehydrogenase (cytochrome) [Colletotrichum costaricense]KAK1515349.1 D-lactate dehydrogenase (cytochrome) [Colletotrichum costaricense]
MEKICDTDDIISIDPEDLFAHGFSDYSSINVDRLAVAVAYPRNTDHVSIIARICHKWRVPIVPFSGGSSLEGHVAAPFGGVSTDFCHMDQMVELHENDMDVVVQPGLCWADLNAQLAKSGTGLFFPIDPAPNAKIGGMIGTNCSGTNAVRYGTMRDWVMNVTIVLADGSIIKTRRRPRKCSAGYNLNGIIVGSEGTLEIVTEATLNLAPIPEYESVTVIPFSDLSTAVNAAAAIIRKGVPVAALELMDEVQMKVINQGGTTRPRVWAETPTLFFKFSGTKGIVNDNIRTVQEIVANFNPGKIEWAKDSHEKDVLWSARKESLYSMLALRKEGEELWTTVVAVPLSRLAEVISESKNDAERLGLYASVKGHVGDSNFHENIIYNKTDPEQLRSVETVVKGMVKRAIGVEGTCTGEHGIGYGKKASLELEVGTETLLAMVRSSIIMFDFCLLTS